MHRALDPATECNEVQIPYLVVGIPHEEGSDFIFHERSGLGHIPFCWAKYSVTDGGVSIVYSFVVRMTHQKGIRQTIQRSDTTWSKSKVCGSAPLHILGSFSGKGSPGMSVKSIWMTRILRPRPSCANMAKCRVVASTFYPHWSDHAMNKSSL